MNQELRLNENIPTLNECIEAATETKCMLVKDGAIAEIPALLETYFPETAPNGRAVLLVADENTFKAAGSAVLETLKAAGIKTAAPFIFDNSKYLHADYKHSLRLKEIFLEAAKQYGTIVPIAAGAGTINDLVKRAALESGLRYFCVPTAASVDGYTSDGAALLSDGFKQTFPCDAPLVLAADSSVLVKAPAYLSSSGFGDLAGKIIAGTDWIIADKVYNFDGTGGLVPGSQKIDPKAWAMVQLPLHENLKKSSGAAQGDTAAVEILFESLAVTGFSMQYMRNSRPVSGCEHLWSHVWEMEDLCVNGIPVTHGHKVALGTLAAAAFTECLFAEKPRIGQSSGAASSREREAQVRKAFDGLEKPGEAAVKTANEKFITPGTERGRRIGEALAASWDNIRSAVLERLVPYNEIRSMLKEAGCPVSPAEIGLTRERTIETAIRAQMMRVRFTVLDLAWEAGVFGDVLKRMEASELYLR
jgi:glycerol-1-phosphate dehydrogenase [NAD(P)+]